MTRTRTRTQTQTQIRTQTAPLTTPLTAPLTTPLTKNQTLYFARILPPSFNLLDLKLRTVTDTYFVGTDKRTKHAFLFSYSDLDKSVFLNRSDALELVKKAEAKYKEEHKDDVVVDEEEWL